MPNTETTEDEETSVVVDDGDGEQLDLIDVHPENAKEIAKIAKAYKTAQRLRSQALEEEVAQKEMLLDTIHKSDIQSANGHYRLNADGVKITITPRKESVKVKCDDDEDGEQPG